VDDIVQNAHDLAHGELPLAFECGAQRLALDVRHGVPEQVALFPGRQEGNDMRML
jgi:hypothetical protein